MTIVFICQALDEDDPILATSVEWVRALSQKSSDKKIIVLTLRKGHFTLPENVTVYKISGVNRVVRLISFYKQVLSIPCHKVDCFFIHQGGPYPLLLMPFKIFLGKPVYQWKAHPSISPMMKFYARFCDSILFTSTGNAFPMALPNVKVVGQGVDIKKFRLLKRQKKRDMITVGRVAPVKRLEIMIRALQCCNARHKKSFRLDIFGPTFDSDRPYKERLKKLLKDNSMSDMITFHAPVPHEQLPNLLSKYRLFLNFSKTALDRAVVEAMACGLPVISSNPCVEEMIPPQLGNSLIVPEDDVDEQAGKIYDLLTADERRLNEMGKALRTVVVQNHSVEALCDKMLMHMNGYGKNAAYA